MAELLSDKFRMAIKEKAEKGDFDDDRISDLYEAVEGMNDDDFREYMFTNRQYFKQNMPAAVDEIEGFQKYVSEEPSWGVKDKIDYEKITGSADALDNFFDYDMKDFEYFGSKVGMSGKDFMKRMADDKTALDRRRIARGEDAGGWFESPTAFVKNLGGAYMGVFSPRTREAIERGESPKTRDYLLDIGSNVVEGLPVGNIAKGSKAINALSNFIVPLAEETVDYAAYDVNNPRGNFSNVDWMKGGGINLATPRLLKKIGAENIGATKSFLNKGPQGNVSDILGNKIGPAVYSNRQAPGPVGYVLSPVIEWEKEQDKKRIQQKNREAAEKKYKDKITRKLLEEEPEEE